MMTSTKRFSDAQLQQRWNQLCISKPAHLRSRFTAYCRVVMTQKRQGRIAAKVAAKYIAGTMFIEGVLDDPQLAEVTVLAGELELPSKHTRNVSDKWRELSRLVRELRPE